MRPGHPGACLRSPPCSGPIRAPCPTTRTTSPTSDATPPGAPPHMRRCRRCCATGSRGSIATPAILAAIVAIFVMMVAVSGDVAFPSRTLLRWGAQFGPAVANGEWWRLLSAMWLHAHPLHLGLNARLPVAVRRLRRAPARPGGLPDRLPARRRGRLGGQPPVPGSQRAQRRRVRRPLRPRRRAADGGDDVARERRPRRDARRTAAEPGVDRRHEPDPGLPGARHRQCGAHRRACRRPRPRLVRRAAQPGRDTVAAADADPESS